MELVLTDDQEELRSITRSFLEKALPEERVRELADTVEGYDPAIWTRMAQELGLHGLAIPEEFGGAGFGLAELGVVLEELGGSLYGGPFLSTVVLAARALVHSGDVGAQTEYLPRIAAGELIATLAVTEKTGQWAEDAVDATARHESDGFRIDGTKQFVLDGASAEVLLVAARTDAGLSLFLVDAKAPGLTVVSVPTLDQTRKQAQVVLSDVPAVLLGVEGEGWSVVRRTLEDAGAALSAERLGAAERIFEITVAYAKVREQYGRPIGSFQAIKHMCAEMMLEIESMRSVVHYALRTADEQPQALGEATSVAEAFTAEHLCHVAGECIQILGGIGVTWEHPAHLYFKRAQTSRAFFAEPSEHRENLLNQRAI
ncbi:acyl-CoA dehydrogenase family protein [Nocardioides sp. WS12]|uniref:acyl-CoA dehydrogenase family protein n=1 Tax=Nocardioides sp. WS12 TaxID=2486272 RepID=UPI0015FB0925|nr:acyl-CoA dehydrogenase family protein [Nocardioides sp. WS12]